MEFKITKNGFLEAAEMYGLKMEFIDKPGLYVNNEEVDVNDLFNGIFQSGLSDADDDEVIEIKLEEEYEKSIEDFIDIAVSKKGNKVQIKHKPNSFTEYKYGVA